MKACGVPSVPGQDKESWQYLEAILKQAETASSWAQQAQDETDKNYRRLNAYIRDELPAQLVKAYEKVEQNGVAGRLRPLDDSVRNAASRIDSCAGKLDRISWNGRLMGLAVLLGLFTVLVTGGLVRCAFFDDKMEEAKRYEVFGRRVEMVIGKYKSKEQERMYHWLGGRP